ncbi:hypothetical protein WJX73_000160 [Symbiochloris irregularis]|uniref:RING-type domain-containing protein n=1 Tax=Symbiochloris irregularis TaxID=706552 RepID=A0AAW1P0G5_9CHLO
MTDNSTDSIQHISYSSFQPSQRTQDDSVLAEASHLDPQAPSFVPGLNTGQHVAALPQRRKNHSQSGGGKSGRHSGGTGGRGLPGRPGGLSKALQADKQIGRREATSEAHAAWDEGMSEAALAELPPLGRSPSARAYVPANHLLNFQYTSPQQGRGAREGRNARPGHRPQPFSRNQFLQANFRFLVSDAADLRKHAADADLMLDWEDVVEVEMPVTHPLQCPISLESPPPCAHITPCGHVFGFAPIMAHLLSHGGPALRKASPCPLCFAPVAARELRLLRTQQIQPHQVGQAAGYLAEIAAQVVAEGGMDATMEAPALYAAIDALAARAGAWAERHQRIQAPAHLRSSGPDAAETPEAAAAHASRLVRQAAEKAAEQANAARVRDQSDAQLDQEFPSLPALAPSSRSAPRASSPQPTVAPALQDRVVQARMEDAEQLPPQAASIHHMQAAFSDDDSSPRHGIPVPTTDGPPEAPTPAGPAEISGTSPPVAMPAQPANKYLFYQAADGQWVFMSPLDMRILASVHGSLQSCPQSLQAPILSMETITQTETTRRRFKSLAHLPLTGTFALAEIDLASSVPPEALAPFAKELAARQRRHERQEAQQAERSRQEAAYEASLVTASAAPSAAQLRAMPRPGAPQDRGLDSAELEAALEASLISNQPPVLSSSPSLPQEGVSFANMTKMGYAASGPSLPQGPGLNPGAAPSGRAMPAAGPSPSQAPPVQGWWGAAAANKKTQGAAAPAQPDQVPLEQDLLPTQPAGKKGKRQMVVLGSMQRRY